MSEPKPSLYFFYGDDVLAMREAVADMRRRLGDSATADLNFAHFGAKSSDLTELAQVCASAPFLASRRLIVVDDAGRLATTSEARAQVETLLGSLTETTALVLIDQIDLTRRTALSDFRKRSHLFRWTQDHPESSHVQLFSRKRGGEFVSWMIQRCQALGGEIDGPAAQTLAGYVLDDPDRADQELHKLLDYVDRSRPIRIEDVELLTPLTSQSDVFAMVDALGNRQSSQALAHLHRLLIDEDPMFALAMIVRQFRLILQAREALDSGLNPRQILNTPDWVANKIAAQARNFTLSQLQAAHQKLSDIDFEAKSGGMELPTALDILVAGLAN
jgi:DNA polymerase-3 subunit delta